MVFLEDENCKDPIQKTLDQCVGLGRRLLQPCSLQNLRWSARRAARKLVQSCLQI